MQSTMRDISPQLVNRWLQLRHICMTFSHRDVKQAILEATYLVHEKQAYPLIRLPMLLIMFRPGATLKFEYYCVTSLTNLCNRSSLYRKYSHCFTFVTFCYVSLIPKYIPFIFLQHPMKTTLNFLPIFWVGEGY